jgi:hypothetical protein
VYTKEQLCLVALLGRATSVYFYIYCWNDTLWPIYQFNSSASHIPHKDGFFNSVLLTPNYPRRKKCVADRDESEIDFHFMSHCLHFMDTKRTLQFAFCTMKS